MRKWIVRHERYGDNVQALWEDEEGNRWYVAVVINGGGAVVMAKDWTQDETIRQLESLLAEKDAEIEKLREERKLLREKLLGIAGDMYDLCMYGITPLKETE